jgi:hypothetical protein
MCLWERSGVVDVENVLSCCGGVISKSSLRGHELAREALVGLFQEKSRKLPVPFSLTFTF